VYVFFVLPAQIYNKQACKYVKNEISESAKRSNSQIQIALLLTWFLKYFQLHGANDYRALPLELTGGAIPPDLHYRLALPRSTYSGLWPLKQYILALPQVNI